MAAQNFTEVLKTYLLDFVKAQNLESKDVIEMLVLYLQDKKPGFISFNRLKVAYEKKQKDKPLK